MTLRLLSKIHTAPLPCILVFVIIIAGTLSPIHHEADSDDTTSLDRQLRYGSAASSPNRPAPIKFIEEEPFATTVNIQQPDASDRTSSQANLDSPVWLLVYLLIPNVFFICSLALAAHVSLRL